MEEKNEYSDIASQKDTEALLLIIDDETQHAQYRLAAYWELEKRNAVPPHIKDLEERLRQEAQKAKNVYQGADKYSTFWPRLGASIIDGLIIIFGGIALSFFILLFVDSNSNGIVIWEIALEFLAYYYFIYMHATSGQTIGKKAMNVKVVRYIDEGPIGWRAAYRRDIVPLILLALVSIVYITSDPDSIAVYNTIENIDAISGLWALAEIITMLTNEKRRALHDFIAGTVVVRC